MIGATVHVARALFGSVTKTIFRAEQCVPRTWFVGVATYITKSVGRADTAWGAVGIGLAEVNTGVGQRVTVSSVGTVGVGCANGELFTETFFADLAFTTINITGTSGSAGAIDADFVTGAIAVGGAFGWIAAESVVGAIGWRWAVQV